MKNYLIYLTIAFVGLLSTSCNDDDDAMDYVAPTMNIVELAQANGFNKLAEALTRADLVGALQGSGPFTVFAPTDDAFDALLAAVGQESIESIPVSVLQDILLYHVVDGNISSAMITPGSVTTLSGQDVELLTAGGIKVNGTDVINPFDVDATNGIIHTIDAVLVPPTVAPFVNSVLEPAYFNVEFSKLVASAAKADLVGTLLNTPDLTIFAPTNAAFEASGIDPDAVDAETLAAVLTYHVVGAKVMSTGLPMDAATVNGNQMYFSITSEGVYINGDTQITAVDIESGSGVIHLIDKVLLPPSGNLVTTAVELSAGGEFTSLIAALQRTANEGTAGQNLINVLSGDGPFTVFAPTNAAFAALLDSNNDWNGLNDIPLEALIDVLTYHVVPARAYDKDLPSAVDANNQLPTANGGMLTFDLGNGTINESVNIIGVNTNATNGVIHVIDAVLIPSN
jgi:transforming growth factor-beta-induced protein